VNVRNPVFWYVKPCAVRCKCIRISEVLIANIFEAAFFSKVLVKCQWTYQWTLLLAHFEVVNYKSFVLCLSVSLYLRTSPFVEPFNH